ncbi:hypothetical protein ACRAWB_17940 [Leifsonia poae]
MTILHVAHRSDWDAALQAGDYRTSTRGRDGGVILDTEGRFRVSDR